MKCIIKSDIPGRLRIHAVKSGMTLTEADILECYLKNTAAVTEAKVYDRTCDAVICYEKGCRDEVLRSLSLFAFDSEEALAMKPEFSARKTNRHFADSLVMLVVRRLLSKFFMPRPIWILMTVIKSAKYIKEGMGCLAAGKVEVPVLDATAIAVSLLRRDYKTAASVMFLLSVGELLEEWTHKRSVDDLARTMALNVDNVWKIVDGKEVLVPIEDVEVGDSIMLRSGNVVPLDGRVLSGEAMVNQSSITGEPLSVLKDEGSYVYAGTVVEEGDCIVAVDKSLGSGRYDRIISMIEESEKLKSASEDRASHLADKLVPYSLGSTALTYLITRNVAKALAILMVDFSCALKLSMPITVLSAMKEAGDSRITVKGGKFLEAMAAADTIVFDKTGTITHAKPRVKKVIAFAGNDEKEMLRTAACLEEHYPHSMANAVVSAAKDSGLMHEERHSKVEYVVAHGISSILDGQKTLIGSHHFVFQDEGCVVPEGEEEKFNNLPGEYSHLYLAIGGKLAAVICVEDPVRKEAADVIEKLREEGICRVVMMTGDSRKTAEAVASTVGVDEVYAEVLPEDKAGFIAEEHRAGRKVIMIGDGINDSPALSEADIGIAISDGAAIAREIADITIAAEDLYSLVTLRKLSNRLMKRIDNNYRFIIGFNFGLIVLGVAGILPPTTTALLHNASTLGISVYDTTSLLPDPKNR